MGRLTAPPARLGAPPYSIGMAPAQATTSSTLPSGMAKAFWHGWYKLARWRRLRLATFLADNYTCRMCGRVEGDPSALTCDHIRAHRGDPALFWGPANLQTLCTVPCHVKHKQRLEQDTRGRGGVWT